MTVVPKRYNFAAILILQLVQLNSTRSTRSPSIRDCLICSIAKLKGKEKHSLCKVTAPTPKAPQQSVQTSEKCCTKCLSILGRGPHYCTPATRHENLRTIGGADPIGAEQVTSSVLTSKEASPHGTVRLTQPSGKLLPIRRGKFFLTTITNKFSFSFFF